MTKRTVRVTRTWDVEVDAEYGDDRSTLCAKVTDDHLDATPPDADQRVVLEEHESRYNKWWERPDADQALAELDRQERADRRSFWQQVREWAASAAKEA